MISQSPGALLPSREHTVGGTNALEAGTQTPGQAQLIERTICIRGGLGSGLLTTLKLEPVQVLKESSSPVQVSFFNSQVGPI